MSSNQQQNCTLCNQKIENFITLVSHSLYGKYSSSQNFYYTKEVNEILEQAISPAYIQFQDHNYYDDDQEYLKREYKTTEYSKKIQMLSQYYKFHRDLPIWNNRHIEGIMGKYYGRVKDVDYKKIKQVLKKQQGISLTTHKSFSSLDGSQYTKKSRYSTMLNDLEHSNDSIFLKDLCQKIGKAFKKVKVENNFKGTYYSGQKKFQQFIKKQKKRIQNQKYEANNPQNQNFNLSLKKMKFNPKLNTNTKQEEFTDFKQMIFTSNHSGKDRKYATIKNTISVQKTTANQTISREQKTRRDKSKNNALISSRSSLSRKKSISNILSQAYRSKAKSIKNYNIASIINNNQNLKTINEIYKPTIDKPDKKQRQKIALDIGRKSSSKQLITKLKMRSNSHQNLPTSATLNRDASKKRLIGTLKPNRSASQKHLPIKLSTIELQNMNSLDRPLTARQNPTHGLRTNSIGKSQSQNNQKQYTTNKIAGEKGFNKKRNSAIEEILEKKLAVFKRKQPIF